MLDERCFNLTFKTVMMMICLCVAMEIVGEFDLCYFCIFAGKNKISKDVNQVIPTDGIAVVPAGASLGSYQRRFSKDDTCRVWFKAMSLGGAIQSLLFRHQIDGRNDEEVGTKERVQHSVIGASRGVVLSSAPWE